MRETNLITNLIMTRISGPGRALRAWAIIAWLPWKGSLFIARESWLSRAAPPRARGIAQAVTSQWVRNRDGGHGHGHSPERTTPWDLPITVFLRYITCYMQP